LGIRTGTRDCKLLCRRPDGDRVLRLGLQRPEQPPDTEAERSLLLGSENLRKARGVQYRYRCNNQAVSALQITWCVRFEVPILTPLTLAGYHKSSIAYMSYGSRRHNQPFTPTPYGPEYVQGDVIGVGYRPRTGTVFYTRNGKKLDDVAHGLKTQNFFPTVGANGPCRVHVNFGQMGFVFIEANVKKWGLAPMTGSLAPPPPYGSEQGSILLDSGREGIREGMARNYISAGYGHGRSSSQQMRLGRNQPTSPGPQRSPTDISLAALSLANSYDDDAGEGNSADVSVAQYQGTVHGLGFLQPGDLPPEYTSPVGSPNLSQTASHEFGYWEENTPLLVSQQQNDPPIPTYDAAVRDSTTPTLEAPRIRLRADTETRRGQQPQ
jgi:hypothetical protein